MRYLGGFVTIRRASPSSGTCLTKSSLDKSLLKQGRPAGLADMMSGGSFHLACGATSASAVVVLTLAPCVLAPRVTAANSFTPAPEDTLRLESSQLLPVSGGLWLSIIADVFPGEPW